MSEDLKAVYQTLTVPGVLLFRVFKIVILAPLRLLLSAVLWPFRVAYAFLASLWWLLPFTSHHHADPPTLFDFLLAPLFIGLVAGVVLYLTSRILFALPPLFGFEFMDSTIVKPAIPTHPSPLERRRRRENAMSQLMRDAGSAGSAENTSNRRRKGDIAPLPRISDDNASVLPRLGQDDAPDWEKRWAQVQRDSSSPSATSPSNMLSPLNAKDGLSVAGQVILEESSDDQDLEYF